MSKTDNTDPLLVQWADTTKPGHEFHSHWSCDCDYYTPVDNIKDFKANGKYGGGCHRVAHHFGGMRYYGGAAKFERKFRRRRIRQRERYALEQVRKSNYQDDFDLLPIREDRRTIDWDLS